MQIQGSELMRWIGEHVRRVGVIGLATVLVASATVVLRARGVRAGSGPGAFPAVSDSSPRGPGPGTRSGGPVRTSADPGVGRVVRDDTATLADPAEGDASS